MKRVVVTGVGAITPLGIGAEAYWDGLVSGRSGVRYIESFDTSKLEVKIGGEVRGFVAKDFMDFKSAKRMDRFAQFAVASAREAIEQSGLQITDENRENIGVVINTGGGGIPAIENEVTNMVLKGPKAVHPLLIPVFAPNMASCQVSMAFGIHGPSVTSVAACAAGVQAFVDAVHMIQRDEADVVITGGTEAGLTPVAIASLASMTALSRRNDPPDQASRPFDKNRDGFVFSEGSAIMVLETLEHAQERGAHIIAEVLGGAYTSDAYHITASAPGGRGAALAMKRALKRSNLQPSDIDFVAAHATATEIGDISETEALKTAFGDHAYKLSISANKSAIGHLLGAAGATSSLSAVLAIRDQIVPPTLNLTEPDPRCDLDYTPLVAKKREVRRAISDGFGFGGQNAVCVFQAFEG
ncbi:beta-ketoacyl-ACP synthase II [soil metagenome]